MPAAHEEMTAALSAAGIHVSEQILQFHLQPFPSSGCCTNSQVLIVQANPPQDE
jgi:hypothetical protein